jgi:hypothetical protein
MATISKHYGKWQAQIRIKDYPNQTISFLLKNMQRAQKKYTYLMEYKFKKLCIKDENA